MADPVGWRVVVDVAPAELELVADRLFVAGALGIEERDAPYDRVQLLAGMPDEASARAAAGSLADAIVQPVFDDGWADEWRAWARPVQVGEVLVRPPWSADGGQRPAGVTVVDIDPGRAFGSGAHETTRLALAALLELDIDARTRLLDVGCGSGVLGVAVARVRGASVTAIDVDPAAIEATVANAVRNGVEDLVDASTTPLAALDGPFDVVVANILAVTLRELAAQLARAVRAGGTVIMSGMLDEQLAGVDAASVGAGLEPVGVRSDAGWCARTYVARPAG
jgi:ribosomal protein L11 methyltransferase